MTQLLNLEGVKVIDYRIIEGIGIILSLENTVVYRRKQSTEKPGEAYCGEIRMIRFEWED